MLLQENEIRIEFTNEEILIILLTVIFFIIFLLAMFLHTYINDRLHKQYHKGYNKAKSDKVEYYKTIKEIIDSFEKILSELKKDNIEMSIITTELLINFKSSLQEYYT